MSSQYNLQNQSGLSQEGLSVYLHVQWEDINEDEALKPACGAQDLIDNNPDVFDSLTYSSAKGRDLSVAMTLKLIADAIFSKGQKKVHTIKMGEKINIIVVVLEDNRASAFRSIVKFSNDPLAKATSEMKKLD